MDKLTFTEFQKMFQGAVNNLYNKKQLVNELNVFPVPDGDTGTNMYLTLKTAMDETNKRKPENLRAFGEAICDGALIGGRGNSGVILSQILKGFFESLDGKDKVTIPEFAEALISATAVAYQAVIKPVEGTILTVINTMSKKALSLADKESDFFSFFRELLKTANETLKRTPELLPVLKEAGVVDAGGQGLVFIMEGMLLGLKGEIKMEKGFEESIEELDHQAIGGKLKFKYDTVILTEVPTIDPDKLRKQLEQFGDSIVVARSGNLTKLHVHSNEPYDVMKFVMQYGPLKEARIENMQEEQEEFLAHNKGKQPKPIVRRAVSIVSVSQGKGFDEIFLSLGVDVLISGGQTMNPSINDILAGIAKCEKKYVVVLPNNSNIILAANEAKKLVKDKVVEVIPTRNMVQAIPVILSFNADESFDVNISRAKKILSETHSFSVTYSVRDTKLNNIKIKKGDVLGLTDDKIVLKGKNPEKVLIHLFEKNKNIVKDYELISVYYGEKIKKEDAENVAKAVEKMFPELEVEVVYGGQPFYYYLVSLE